MSQIVFRATTTGGLTQTGPGRRPSNSPPPTGRARDRDGVPDVE